MVKISYRADGCCILTIQENMRVGIDKIWLTYLGDSGIISNVAGEPVMKIVYVIDGI